MKPLKEYIKETLNDIKNWDTSNINSKHIKGLKYIEVPDDWDTSLISQIPLAVEYIRMKDLKDGQIYWICIKENGKVLPFKSRFFRHDSINTEVFINPDDEREFYLWQDVINAVDKNNNQAVATFKNEKEAKEFSKIYNK